MIELPDVNVLFALHEPDYESHDAAITWFNSVTYYATTPITESGLVRLLMNPRSGSTEFNAAEAWQALDAIRHGKGATFWSDDIEGVTSNFRYAAYGYRQISDLHLLELAKRHNGKLVTFDKRIPAVLRPADRRFVRVLVT